MSSRSIPALALTMCLGAAMAAPPDPADPRQGATATRPRPAAATATAVPAAAVASGVGVADPGVGDWRLANRRVLEAGGWRALLRESQAASAPAGGHHHH